MSEEKLRLLRPQNSKKLSRSQKNAKDQSQFHLNIDRSVKLLNKIIISVNF